MPKVAEAHLGLVPRSRGVRAYRRSDLPKRDTEMLADLADWLTMIGSGWKHKKSDPGL